MTRIAKRPPDQIFTLATDQWSEPFWAAAKEHRLVCAQCGNCGHFRHPPTAFCPNCRSQAINWITLSGKGTIYSYTIVERATVPGTEESIPFVPAVVEMEGAGGMRLITNIVDTPIDAIKIDAAVTVVFDTIPSGAVIPRFKIS